MYYGLCGLKKFEVFKSKGGHRADIIAWDGYTLKVHLCSLSAMIGSQIYIISLLN